MRKVFNLIFIFCVMMYATVVFGSGGSTSPSYYDQQSQYQNTDLTSVQDNDQINTQTNHQSVSSSQYTIQDNDQTSNNTNLVQGNVTGNTLSTNIQNNQSKNWLGDHEIGNQTHELAYFGEKFKDATSSLSFEIKTYTKEMLKINKLKTHPVQGTFRIVPGSKVWGLSKHKTWTCDRVILNENFNRKKKNVGSIEIIYLPNGNNWDSFWENIEYDKGLYPVEGYSVQGDPQVNQDRLEATAIDQIRQWGYEFAVIADRGSIEVAWAENASGDLSGALARSGNNYAGNVSAGGGEGIGYMMPRLSHWAHIIACKKYSQEEWGARKKEIDEGRKPDAQLYSELRDDDIYMPSYSGPSLAIAENKNASTDNQDLVDMLNAIPNVNIKFLFNDKTVYPVVEGYDNLVFIDQVITFCIENKDTMLKYGFVPVWLGSADYIGSTRFNNNLAIERAHSLVEYTQKLAMQLEYSDAIFDSFHYEGSGEYKIRTNAESISDNAPNRVCQFGLLKVDSSEYFLK